MSKRGNYSAEELIESMDGALGYMEQSNSRSKGECINRAMDDFDADVKVKKARDTIAGKGDKLKLLQEGNRIRFIYMGEQTIEGIVVGRNDKDSFVTINDEKFGNALFKIKLMEGIEPLPEKHEIYKLPTPISMMSTEALREELKKRDAKVLQERIYNLLTESAKDFSEDKVIDAQSLRNLNPTLRVLTGLSEKWEKKI